MERGGERSWLHFPSIVPDISVQLHLQRVKPWCLPKSEGIWGLIASHVGFQPFLFLAPLVAPLFRGNLVLQIPEFFWGFSSMNPLRHFSVALSFIFSVLLSCLLFFHVHSRFQNLVEISDFLLSPLLLSLNFCCKPFSVLYFLVNGTLGRPRDKQICSICHV